MRTTADIIIVGGGNAGCTLAARLSRKYSVILLEAGTNLSEDPAITTPSASGTLIRNVNTYFYPLGHSIATTPAIDSRHPFPAVGGELLGGGSSVNGLQYVTGTADYYQRWSDLVNDPAWNARHAAKAYRKIETFYPPAESSSVERRGKYGPVDVTSVVLNQQAATVFAESVSTVTGVPFNIDYNDWKYPLGSYVFYQTTQTPDSVRVSSYTAYLQSILRPRRSDPDVYVSKCTPNSIQVVTKARAQRILWENSKSPCDHKERATGVLAVVNGECIRFKARHSVILTAGFQSASLLQLSGVGDKEHLESLGIEPKIENSNVGQHMTNHPIISLTGVVPAGSENPFTPLPSDYNSQGLYSGGAQIPNSTGSRSFQLIGSANPVLSGVAPTTFTISGLVLDAKSEGEIRINNSDPNRPPLFDFKYFSHPEDLEQAIVMYTSMYQILVGMGLEPTGPPPTEAATYIQTRFSQAYHWTGMVKMAASAADGVVDSNGRVFGSKNLYVADISVAPLNPLGNTQAIAYLVPYIIAEKLNRL